ncbi:MAG: amino acid adenylation domain-containing protein, partial [Acidobacteriota bacterium]
IAGRTLLETEPLIGFFVNTLVLRGDLTGDPTFRELVGRVRHTVLEAHAHQEVPFEKLVEELEPERSLDHSPLFQVMFVLQNMPPRSGDAKGLRLRPLTSGVEVGNAKFDVNLGLIEHPDGIRGTLSTRQGLFDRTTVRRWCDGLRRLLTAVAADPDQRLRDYQPWSRAERQQVLVQWNDTAVDTGRGSWLDDVFERMRQRPEAVAVTLGGSALSYRELGRRSLVLASYLKAHGVGTEDRIGVCLERSLDLPVTLLAVLRSGAVYVPLDPKNPRQRIAAMIEDAEIDLLVTVSSLVERVERAPASGASELEVIQLDRDAGAIAGVETAGDLPAGMPESTAYVLFTSGSTGRPKGVAVDHRALTNRLRWSQSVYRLDAEDRVLQSASTGFDFSLWELIAPLASGGELVLAPPGAELEPAELVDEIVRRKVTVAHFVPSILGWVQERQELAACRALRRVFVGGEALPAAVRDRFFEVRDAAGLQTELWNQYGPTEATIDATYVRCRARDRGQVVTIGRPVANLRGHIVGPSLQGESIGIGGELALAGVGLARGYVQRPGQTAERFVPDPFGDAAGSRLYLTGDRARLRSDGQIELQGRLDRQIQLRGVRVEPDEVAAVLAQHPEVFEAQADVLAEGEDGARLVAWLVASDATVPADLRSWLQDRLPAAMLPSQFVVLPELPRLPSGKLDRAALEDAAKASEVRPLAAEAAAELLDPIERELASIWSEVLEVAEIGPEDNFFEIGGHSLLAVRLFATIEERVGVRLPIAALFRHPTVRGLAELLRRQALAGAGSVLVPIQPMGRRRPFFCVHAVGGNVFSYVALAQQLPDRPFYGLQAAGLDGEADLDVEAMARRYVSAMRAVQPVGPYLLGGWSMGGVVAFEMARQLQEQGERTGLVVLLDSFAPALASRPHDEVTLLATFAQDLGLPSTELTLPRRRWWQRPRPVATEPLLEQLWTAARRSGRAPEEVGRERLAELYELFKLNSQALAAHRVRPFAGPTALVRAAERNGRQQSRSKDPAHGWGPFADGGLEIHETPGTHFSMVREPHVLALGERLGDLLQRAEAKLNPRSEVDEKPVSPSSN